MSVDDTVGEGESPVRRRTTDEIVHAVKNGMVTSVADIAKAYAVEAISRKEAVILLKKECEKDIKVYGALLHGRENASVEAKHKYDRAQGTLEQIKQDADPIQYDPFVF